MIDYKRKHKLIPSDCFDDREKLKAWIANHFNVPKCGNWFADALIAIAHGRSVSLSGRRHSKSMLSKFAAGFEITPTQESDMTSIPKASGWKFKPGDIIYGHSKSGKYMKGTVHALVTSIRSYQIKEPSNTSALGIYFFVDKTLVESTWHIKTPTGMGTMQVTAVHTNTRSELEDEFKGSAKYDGCDHDLKVYDSGWTKEEYCTKCTHKRKL
jgi:hypothetical protein